MPRKKQPAPEIPELPQSQLRIQRILEATEPGQGECLISTLKPNSAGHPCICVDGTSKPAARVLWECVHGEELTSGQVVHRTCGNKLCVQLKHLKVMTQGELARLGPMIEAKTKPALQRFRRQTVKKGSHLFWTGAKRKKDGKGYIQVNGSTVLVHRFAYEQHFGVKLERRETLERTCEADGCILPTHQVRRPPGYSLTQSDYHKKRLGSALARWERHTLQTPDTNGCKLWTGALDQYGYGTLTLENGDTKRAHIFIFERMRGPIPEGHELGSICGNPNCQTLDHWEPRPVHSHLATSGGPYRFAPGARKPNERQALKEEWLANPNRSFRAVAKLCGVDHRLAKKVWEELRDSGEIVASEIAVGADGKGYQRVQGPRLEKYPLVESDLLRDPQQSDRSLSGKHEVGVQVVRRIRNEMVERLELPSVDVTVGANGQVYPRGGHLQASEIADPTSSVDEETEDDTPGDKQCKWYVREGVRCKNPPRRGYDHCRHHLKHRQRNEGDLEKERAASETIARLREAATDELKRLIGPSLEAAKAQELEMAVTAAANEYRERLVVAPELAALLVLDHLTPEAALRTIRRWGVQLAERLAPGLERSLLAAPTSEAPIALPLSLEFPRDSVQQAVVEGFCWADKWMGREASRYEWRARKERVVVELSSAAANAPELFLREHPEIAIKLQFALWGHYYWSDSLMRKAVRGSGGRPALHLK